MKVSNALFSEMVHDSTSLVGSDSLNKETAVFLLFLAVFLLTFSLLATSAVVYTDASVSARREVSFKKVMRVVPRVWKKPMVILFSMFCLIFLYDILAIVLFFAYQSIISPKNVGMTFYVVFGGFYLVGLVYISTVWQLASVVAVLEEVSYTGHAIYKSHTLIEGKLWVLSVICLKFNLLVGLIQLRSQNLVVHGNNTFSTGIASRITFGVACCLLLAF
ncbi:hypothetical protein NL676_027872 [Syzygium grande]|nr:hypothetical protein NL676_027872 [Syzygium grande]